MGRRCRTSYQSSRLNPPTDIADAEAHHVLNLGCATGLIASMAPCQSCPDCFPTEDGSQDWPDPPCALRAGGEHQSSSSSRMRRVLMMRIASSSPSSAISSSMMASYSSSMLVHAPEHPEDATLRGIGRVGGPRHAGRETRAGGGRRPRHASDDGPDDGPARAARQARGPDLHHTERLRRQMRQRRRRALISCRGWHSDVTHPVNPLKGAIVHLVSHRCAPVQASGPGDVPPGRVPRERCLLAAPGRARAGDAALDAVRGPVLILALDGDDPCAVARRARPALKVRLHLLKLHGRVLPGVRLPEVAGQRDGDLDALGLVEVLEGGAPPLLPAVAAAGARGPGRARRGGRALVAQEDAGPLRLLALAHERAVDDDEHPLLVGGVDHLHQGGRDELGDARLLDALVERLTDLEAPLRFLARPLRADLGDGGVVLRLQRAIERQDEHVSRRQPQDEARAVRVLQDALLVRHLQLGAVDDLRRQRRHLGALDGRLRHPLDELVEHGGPLVLGLLRRLRGGRLRGGRLRGRLRGGRLRRDGRRGLVGGLGLALGHDGPPSLTLNPGRQSRGHSPRAVAAGRLYSIDDANATTVESVASVAIWRLFVPFVAKRSRLARAGPLTRRASIRFDAYSSAGPTVPICTSSRLLAPFVSVSTCSVADSSYPSFQTRLILSFQTCPYLSQTRFVHCDAPPFRVRFVARRAGPGPMKPSQIRLIHSSHRVRFGPIQSCHRFGFVADSSRTVSDSCQVAVQIRLIYLWSVSDSAQQSFQIRVSSFQIRLALPGWVS